MKRAKIEDSDRIFWILMRRRLDSWRDALLIASPDTVIICRRLGWRYSWRHKSLRGKPGRSKIDPEIIERIRRMSKDNATWGAPRIRSELALLGHEIAGSTAGTHRARARRAWPTPPPASLAPTTLNTPIAFVAEFPQ